MRIRAKLTLRNHQMLQARELLGLTQMQVAEIAEVPVSTVYALESLRYTDHDLGQRARRVADVLELSVADVLPAGLEGQRIESTVTRIVESDIARMTSVCCRPSLSMEEEVAEEELHAAAKKALDTVLKTLTFRERETVKLLFGLNGGRPYTLEEVAHILKVSHERIRQIEAKAVCKLQQPCIAGKLVPFIDM